MTRRARRCSSGLGTKTVCLLVLGFLTMLGHSSVAQELGGAGTLQGTVKDPTGAVMVAVTVNLAQPVSGLRRTTTTDAMGRFAFRNLPQNPYHLEVTAQGFQTLQRDVDVRSGVPIDLDLSLALAGAEVAVSVVGHAEDLLERDPTAHTDIDQSLIEKLPIEAGSGLNQVITMASPGVVADSNGFFHPIGDHAQTQFSIDNQPITDQQSRIYSNQISPDAVQSMEVITGVAPAEYGDKSSLIVHIVTKSGLDQAKPVGSVSFGYGSFKSPTVEANIGGGSHSVGNFLSFSGTRTDRFLDPPEFAALHDAGNSASFFDRLDAKTGDLGTFHLNVQAARSAFDVPEHLRPERQRTGATSTNQHVQRRARLFAGVWLEDAVHGERLRPPGPPDLHAQPGSVCRSASERLAGPHADQLRHQGGCVLHDGRPQREAGRHDWRHAAERELHDRLHRPDVQRAVSRRHGNPSDNAALTTVNQCRGALTVNPDFNPDFLPYDLSRGGSSLAYSQAATIKQQAAYIQDDIKAGNASFKIGLRLDHYDGLTTATLAQPRLGASYAVPGSGTVFRASYGRTLETPYNENLLLSSGVGLNGLFGDGQPLQPGRRNQGEFGIQQGFGRFVVVDVGYFVKHTDNGYDFNVLFNTPIVFPVSWDHSRIDGFTGKINLVEHGGFSAFVVMAHTNAIYSPPGAGGILLEQPDGRLPHRPRPEVQLDHQSPVRLQPGARRLGRAQLAVRLGPRGRLGGQH